MHNSKILILTSQWVREPFYLDKCCLSPVLSKLDEFSTQLFYGPLWKCFLNMFKI